MDLQFDLGDEASPTGHAIIYFLSSSGPQVFATYAICLPISMNFSKYIPPMFANLVESTPVESTGAMPFPPVAEEVSSVEWLRTLAAHRQDDLVSAGTLYSVDLPNIMQMTSEAVGLYAALYNQPANAETQPPNLQSNYSDLTDREKLGELTKLVGRLRDTLGTPESEEVQAELRLLAATLPPKYRTDELLEWATQPGETGHKLATLHLQRSFYLLNEEYLEVADIERQIGELRAQQSAG